LYKFNSCFDSSVPEGSNERIFDEVCVPLLNAALAGYNACLISYGPSKTGKSELLYGNAENPGLIDLAVQEGFTFINSAPENITYTVKFSYWEMNNDSVIDLLDADLEVESHHSEKKVKRNPVLGVYISGLKEVTVEVWKDLEVLIQEGARRSQSLAAKRGTRWHSFLRMSLLREDEDHPETTIQSNLLFVNLKGSDRVGKIGHTNSTVPYGIDNEVHKENQKERLKQGSSINRSIAALGNAIHNVSDFSNRTNTENMSADEEKRVKQKLHSLFGDSKTTMALSEAFCGNTCTVMVGSISATEYHYLETMDTLENLRIANHIPAKPSRGDVRTEAKELFDRIMKLREKQPRVPVVTAPGAPLTEEQEKVEELTAKFEHLIEGDTYIDQRLHHKNERLKAQPPPMRLPDEGSPLWKHHAVKSHKHGTRATFFVPKSSPNDVGKETFTGQWKLNEKSGFGTYENEKFIYEGEWKSDVRHGKKGTLWLKIREQKAPKKKAWTPTESSKEKVKTTSAPRRKVEQDKFELRRVYVGGWKSDKKHGQGVYYYPSGDIYDGEWRDGKREGQGTMYYIDGTKFEGQWQDDKQGGQGKSVDLSTGDVYEGNYLNGLKHGPGVYYYISKGRMYTGEWFMGVAKSGEISEIPQDRREREDIAQEAGVDSIPRDPRPLPSIGLKDSVSVVNHAIQENRKRMADHQDDIDQQQKEEEESEEDEDYMENASNDDLDDDDDASLDKY
jgi:hypothetical protein